MWWEHCKPPVLPYFIVCKTLLCGGNIAKRWFCLISLHVKSCYVVGSQQELHKQFLQGKTLVLPLLSKTVKDLFCICHALTYFAGRIRYTWFRKERKETDMRVYLDVYFILNLILNLFLMGITGLLRGKRSSISRIAVSACLAAVLSTAIYAVSFLIHRQIFLLSLLTVYGMVWFGFRELDRRERRTDLLVLLIVAFVTGGLLNALHAIGALVGSSPRYSIWFILLGLLGIGIAFCVLARELQGAYKRCQTTVQAVLCHEGREYVLRVLFDTGNGLVSPYTGEKVAVLSADFASGLSLDRTQNPVYIPYHSIGGSGILPVYRIDSVTFAGRTPIAHLPVAISDELGGEQEIQMIY